MPGIRDLRRRVPSRVFSLAWLCGLLALAMVAGLVIASSSGDRPHVSAASTTDTGAPSGQPAQVAAFAGGGGAAAPGAAVVPGSGGTGAGATTTTPARANGVQTMSMDARIQGGLTAHQEQAISARLISTHQDAAVAPTSKYWTPAIGQTALARAASWIGMPYSWAGGSASGPTPGMCVRGDGGDLDCHVVGFDCSGLAMYAWGPYASLPHLASSQYDAGGFHPSVDQLLPGDLVFFSAYLSGGTGHVAIYAGDGKVIEAPQSGEVVHWASLSELMADDGAYRGAVRPLTGATPTLTRPSSSVSLTGGTVTLHGTGLAAVNAVHVGSEVITGFVSQTDTAIVVAVPAHRAGKASITVTTSWLAESDPVDLTYARSRPTPPSSTPSSPIGSPSGSPTRSAPPTSGSPSGTPTRSTPPTSGTPTPPSGTPTAPSGSPTPSPSPTKSPDSATPSP